MESRKQDLGVDLTNEQLVEALRTMIRTRALDAKMILLQRQGRIGFYLECRGQEATHLGAAMALEPEDWYWAHYRDQGVPIHKGISILEMVHQILGNSEDNTKGRQMPVHYSFRKQNFVSISSPLAVQIIQAAGCAYAQKVKGDKGITIVSFGDGSSSEGDFHSGMNFAAVQKAPCIFLLENNQFAISTPTSKQSASETFADKAIAYGMPGVRVDGNDLLAMYQAVKEAADRARAGEGPTLIEAVSFRMGAHSTSDDPSRYVDDELYKEWAKKDPVDRLVKYLKKQGVIDDDQIREMEEQAKEEVNEALKEAESVAPMPDPETLWEDLYEELPEMHQVQRERMRQDIAENGIPEGH